LCDWCSSTNIIKGIKSRSGRWAGHVAYISWIRIVFVVEHEEKRGTEIMKWRIQNIFQTFFKGID
jgi:hypothetical protein